MSGRLLWLIMLPFSGPSQRPITIRGEVPAQKHGDPGGLWHPGIVAGFTTLLSRAPSSAASHSPLALFPLSTSASPADWHMLIQGLPAEIRRAERRMENPAPLPQDLHPPALGARPACLWTSPRCSRTLKLGNLWWLTPRLLGSLLELTSGGYVALIATQQVTHKGQDSVFFLLFLVYFLSPSRHFPHLKVGSWHKLYI